jgi:hypothetical protein
VEARVNNKKLIPFGLLVLPLVFASCDDDDDDRRRGSGDSNLSSLSISAGTLMPAFAPGTLNYTATVPNATDMTTVTATTANAAATLTINGTAATSGVAFGPLPLAVGSNPIAIQVTGPNTTKTYNIDVMRQSVVAAQSAYVKASNTDSGDEFGASASLSGNTMAVGASLEDSGSTGINGNEADESVADSGAAYVFTESGGTWTQEAYVKASNTGSLDMFGMAVALDGDTLAVGAPGEASNATGINGNESDDSASGAGAVYVFTRTAGVWTQEAYIKASNTQAAYQFGARVALSGDTLVVGSPGEASDATGVGGDELNMNAPEAGAVYVFTRTAGVWTQQAYVKASNTEASDHFGEQVALSGDTLAVGASDEDSSSTGINGNETDNAAADSGAAYVFTRSGVTWSQQAYIKASNTDALDAFGSALSLSGDTLVVGAPEEDSMTTGINGDDSDNSELEAGAAYVFTRIAGLWGQTDYLKASTVDPGDNFGDSVWLDTDTLLVGAPNEDSSATGVNGDESDNLASASGAAYRFQRSGGVWTQDAYIKASNTESDDRFGTAVAIDGGFQAISAPGEDSSATGSGGNEADNSETSSGAVYVFE